MTHSERPLRGLPCPSGMGRGPVCSLGYTWFASLTVSIDLIIVVRFAHSQHQAKLVEGWPLKVQSDQIWKNWSESIIWPQQPQMTSEVGSEIAQSERVKDRRKNYSKWSDLKIWEKLNFWPQRPQLTSEVWSEVIQSERVKDDRKNCP